MRTENQKEHTKKWWALKMGAGWKQLHFVCPPEEAEALKEFHKAWKKAHLAFWAEHWK